MAGYLSPIKTIFRLSELIVKLNEIENNDKTFLNECYSVVSNADQKHVLVKYMISKFFIASCSKYSTNFQLESFFGDEKKIQIAKDLQNELYCKILLQELPKKGNSLDKLNTIQLFLSNSEIKNQEVNFEVFLHQCLVFKKVLKQNILTENISKQRALVDFISTRMIEFCAINFLNALSLNRTKLEIYTMLKYFAFKKLLLQNCVNFPIVNMDSLKNESISTLLAKINELEPFKSGSNINSQNLDDLVSLKLASAVFINTISTISVFHSSGTGQDFDFINKVVESINENKVNFLEVIFECDDDIVIEFNLLCIKLFKKLKSGKNSLENFINPNLLFLRLLISIQFNIEVIIDWLISNETDFLEYFIYYLKYLKENASGLKPLIAQNSEELMKSAKNSINFPNAKFQDHFFSQFKQFLSDLHSKITVLKRVFPYNCQALLKLLNNSIEVLNN